MPQSLPVRHTMLQGFVRPAPEIRSWRRGRGWGGGPERKDGGLQSKFLFLPFFPSDIFTSLSLESGVFHFVFPRPASSHSYYQLQMASAWPADSRSFSICISPPSSGSHHLPLALRSTPGPLSGCLKFWLLLLQTRMRIRQVMWQVVLSNCAKGSYNTNFLAWFKIPTIRFT